MIIAKIVEVGAIGAGHAAQSNGKDIIGIRSSRLLLDPARGIVTTNAGYIIVVGGIVGIVPDDSCTV